MSAALLDSLGPALQKTSMAMSATTDSLSNALERYMNSTNTICQTMKDFVSEMGERLPDELTNPPQQATVPEFSYPKNSIPALAITPSSRASFALDISTTNMLDSNSDSLKQAATLIETLIETNAKIQDYMNYLNKEQSVMLPTIRAALNAYGLNQSIKQVMTDAPVAHLFCVEDYPYSTWHGLTRIYKLPEKETRDIQTSFISELRRINASEAFINFWDKITPRLASSFLQKYFNIQSTKATASTLHLLQKEYALVLRYRHAVEGNIGGLPPEDDLYKDIPSLQSIISDFTYSFGTSSIMNNENASLFDIENILKPIDEDIAPASGNSSSTTFSTAGKKRRLIPTKMSTKLTENFEWLDRLVRPFGQIAGLKLSDTQFNFLSSNYTIVDGTDKDIREFYANMPDFMSFWHAIAKVFSANELKKFNSVISNFMPNFIKSMHIIRRSVMLSKSGTQNISQDEETLLSLLTKDKKFFPYEMTFREACVITQYLALRNQHTNSPYSRVLGFVRDAFCLEPHIILMAFYIMGYIIKYLDQANSSIRQTNTSQMQTDIHKLLTGNDDVLTSENQAICMNMGMILILDLLYRFTTEKIAFESGKSSWPSLEHISEAKDFGAVRVVDVEDFRQQLSHLVTAANAFQANIPVSVINDSHTQLKSESFLINASALILNRRSPLNYFSRSGHPLLDLNKTIALAVFIANSSDVKNINTNESSDTKLSLEDDEYLRALCLDSSVVNTARGDDINQSRGLNQILSSRFCQIYPNCQILVLNDNIDPYNLPIEKDKTILPISYNTPINQTGYYPQIFPQEDVLSGNSNTIDMDVLNTILLLKDEAQLNNMQLPEKVATVITKDQLLRQMNLSDVSTRIYTLEDDSRLNENTKKLVRIGSDLAVVDPTLDLEAVILQIPDEAKSIRCQRTGPNSCNFIVDVAPNAEPTSQEDMLGNLVHIQPSKGNASINLQLKNIGFEAAGASRKRKRGNDDDDDDDDDLLGLNLANLTGTEAKDIESLKSIFNARNIARDKELYQFYAAKIADTCDDSIKRDQTTNSISSMHELLGLLSSQMSNPEVVNMAIFDYEGAKKIISDITSPLGAYIDSITQGAFTSDETIKKEEDLSKEQSMARNLLRNLYIQINKIKMNVNMLVTRHLEHSVSLVAILKQLETCLKFAMLPLWARVHFHYNPEMYLIDSVYRDMYSYLGEFVTTENGGYYVNIVKFLNYIDTNHADKINSMDIFSRFIYYLRRHVNKNTPYIYIFQNVNVTKTPMIHWYLGIVCIFMAHILETPAQVI